MMFGWVTCSAKDFPWSGLSKKFVMVAPSCGRRVTRPSSRAQVWAAGNGSGHPDLVPEIGQRMHQLAARLGTPEVVALGIGAARKLDLAQLLLGFDPLGHGRHAKARAEIG